VCEITGADENGVKEEKLTEEEEYLGEDDGRGGGGRRRGVRGADRERDRGGCAKEGGRTEWISQLPRNTDEMECFPL